MSLLAAVAGSLQSTRVSLSSMSADLFDLQIGSAAGATLEIQSDGDIIEATNSLGAGDVGDWIIPKSAAGANYEVRATLNAGSLTSGTTGSWLSLGSSQTWSVTRVTPGISSAELLIEIRRASGATLASKTITISASNE